MQQGKIWQGYLGQQYCPNGLAARMSASRGKHPHAEQAQPSRQGVLARLHLLENDCVRTAVAFEALRMRKVRRRLSGGGQVSDG